MNLKFSLEVIGSFDSKALWSIIQTKNVNLAEIEDRVWIYGETTPLIFTKVVKACCTFGEVDGSFHTGR